MGLGACGDEWCSGTLGIVGGIRGWIVARLTRWRLEGARLGTFQSLCVSRRLWCGRAGEEHDGMCGLGSVPRHV